MKHPRTRGPVPAVALLLLLGALVAAACAGHPAGQVPVAGPTETHLPADDPPPRQDAVLTPDPTGDLERLVANLEADHDPQLPAALRKLALAYEEVARAARQEAFALEEQRLAVGSTSAAEAATVRLEAARNRDDVMRRRALRAWIRIADQHPDSELAAEALLMAATIHQDQEDQTEAARRYQQLVDTYPDSPFAPQAWLGLAESAFAHADLASAETYYLQVLQWPFEAPSVPYAMYKLAWVKLNTDQPAEAARILESLITQVDALSAPSASQTSLRHEAARDLVFALSLWRAMGAAEAVRKLESVAADAAERNRLLSALASRYDDGGRAAEARVVRAAMAPAAP